MGMTPVHTAGPLTFPNLSTDSDDKPEVVVQAPPVTESKSELVIESLEIKGKKKRKSPERCSGCKRVLPKPKKRKDLKKTVKKMVKKSNAKAKKSKKETAESE